MDQATSSLLGIFLGIFLKSLYDYIMISKNNNSEATYAAIRILCVLDEFIEDCVKVSYDDGETDSEGIYHYRSDLPDIIDYPSDINWKSMDHNLVFEILNINNLILDSQNYLRVAIDHWIDPPYDDLGGERKYQYSSLGLIAINISEKLRKKYSIPEIEKINKAEDWDIKEFLESTKTKNKTK